MCENYVWHALINIKLCVLGKNTEKMTKEAIILH